MSDPHGGNHESSRDDPYGDAPFKGQSRPEQPPAPPAPYGTPYGSGPWTPYGQPAPGYGAPSPYVGRRDPDRRPGTVLGAAITAIVMSSLVALFSVVMVIVAVAVGDGELTSEERIGIGVIFAVMLVLSVVAIVCAALTIRRSPGARVTLLVLGFISAGLCLVSALANLSTTYGQPASAVLALLWLGGVVTVLCLLLTRDVRDWFATRPSKNSVVVPYQSPPDGPRYH